VLCDRHAFIQKVNRSKNTSAVTNVYDNFLVYYLSFCHHFLTYSVKWSNALLRDNFISCDSLIAFDLLSRPIARRLVYGADQGLFLGGGGGGWTNVVLAWVFHRSHAFLNIEAEILFFFCLLTGPFPPLPLPLPSPHKPNGRLCKISVMISQPSGTPVCWNKIIKGDKLCIWYQASINST